VSDEVNHMNRKKAKFDTSLGNFTVELFNDKAPLTVGNFVKLVDDGFYNGLIFHRVIPRFMIQTGCPHGTGFGGPGYTIKDEFHPDLKHDEKGMLSMANTGRPNTGGSQFLITVEKTPWLDGKHAVFGKVIEHYDVVEKISHVEKNRNDKPLKDVVINKITLID
jgi:cyclophilin family peptidyl-prolyl cis-trans isomerase